MTISSDPRIEVLRAADLVPYESNPRTHSGVQIKQIAKSIREFGFTNPVLIDDSGGIIAGHGRVLAAVQLGIDEVPCIRLSHLTDAQRRAYVIADNKLALNAGWDMDLLRMELGALADEKYDLSVVGFSDEDLLQQLGPDSLDDDTYSKKVLAPIYEPKNEKPKIEDMMDGEKCRQLVDEINSADIPEDEKDFLIAAAGRHVVFNYKRIADYYAHSDKPVQELMDRSALVIIDFERAIADGYVKLTEEIQAQYLDEYPYVTK